MIIHPFTPKRKKRKPTAKQRELAQSWEKLLEKYETKSTTKTSGRTSSSNNYIPDIRSTKHIPSRDSRIGLTSKKPIPQYTGDAMIGIGQMHKSNAVPVFKQEDAKDLAQMRR